MLISRIDADPKAIERTNFTANQYRAGNTTMFFIIEEMKKNILHFSERTVKLFCFNIILYKMTQYNTLNVKLSNSQLSKIKSRIKNGAEVTLNFSEFFWFIILVMILIFLTSCY